VGGSSRWRGGRSSRLLGRGMRGHCGRLSGPRVSWPTSGAYRGFGRRTRSGWSNSGLSRKRRGMLRRLSGGTPSGRSDLLGDVHSRQRVVDQSSNQVHLIYKCVQLGYE
jgi:hypothetical protein